MWCWVFSGGCSGFVGFVGGGGGGLYGFCSRWWGWVFFIVVVVGFMGFVGGGGVGFYGFCWQKGGGGGFFFVVMVVGFFANCVSLRGRERWVVCRVDVRFFGQMCGFERKREK